MDEDSADGERQPGHDPENDIGIAPALRLDDALAEGEQHQRADATACSNDALRDAAVAAEPTGDHGEDRRHEHAASEAGAHAMAEAANRRVVIFAQAKQAISVTTTKQSAVMPK